MYAIEKILMSLPLLVEERDATPEQLAWLGYPNLLVARDEWKTECDNRMSKLRTDACRKDRSKKPDFVALAQGCSSAYWVVNMIDSALENCEWKPLFPVYRKSEHFLESSTVWVFDDQAETPRFGPAYVICVDAKKNRVLLKLYDAGDHGFWTDFRGCNLFTIEEFGYLVNDLKYAETLLQSCCGNSLDAGIILAMIRAGKERFDSFALS